MPTSSPATSNSPNATGAEIGFSSVASPEFPTRKLDDGERLELGEVVLEFRHTPGHTPESLSIVVWEHADDESPYGVLTGDTLFIGDVGRPDLLASIGVTKEELAEQLYDSLHDKLMVLPDSTRLSGPRRRLGVRQEPVDRDLLDDRRAARDELRTASREQAGLLRPRHRRPASGTELFRVRRHLEP